MSRISYLGLPDATGWILDTDHLGALLDVAFLEHRGDIWLFNNDLHVFESEHSFGDLYMERIAVRLRERIGRVIFVVNDEKLERGSLGSRAVAFVDRFARATPKCELSFFALSAVKEKHLEHFAAHEVLNHPRDSWIFYTHTATLESGVALLRPRQDPFQGSDVAHVFAWFLTDHPIMCGRLRRAFAPVFQALSSGDSGIEPLKRVSPTGSGAASCERPDAEGSPIQPAGFFSVRRRADLLLLSALGWERDAVLDELRQRLNCSVGRVPSGCDGCDYAVIRSERSSAHILAVIASINAMGGVAAAAATMDLLERWRPSDVLLVGCAGGHPTEDRPRLGDVVVAHSVVGYELALVRDRETKFQPYVSPHGPRLYDAAVRAARNWNAREMRLKRTPGNEDADPPLPPDWSYEPPNGPPVPFVHTEYAVASGSKLVASPSVFTELEYLNRKIRAVEMEGDGVGYACARHWTRPGFLLVKGIMDRADPETRGLPTREEASDSACSDPRPNEPHSATTGNEGSLSGTRSAEALPLKDRWGLYATHAAGAFTCELLIELGALRRTRPGRQSP